MTLHNDIGFNSKGSEDMESERTNKKLSYRLENMASAWCTHLIIMRLSGIGFLSSVTRYVWDFFLAKIHGNGRARVYKNSTLSILTCPFYRTLACMMYRHKKYTDIN